MPITEGPLCFENWKNKEAGKSRLSIEEFLLFSDAEIPHDFNISFGPYQLLSTRRISKDPKNPAMILRRESYANTQISSSDIEPFTKEKPEIRYHGGSAQDEIAALVSLCLGIRLKVGLISRTFTFTDNHYPLGTPFSLDADKNPVIIFSDWSGEHYGILPDFKKEIDISNVKKIQTLLKLSEKDANALVCSARMYQESVWIAESAPELAWLMIVSSVETAAGHWQKESELPVERFKLSQPGKQLIPVLECAGGDELVETVANAFVDYMGATKKFINFMLKFKPSPPSVRPSEEHQIHWEDRKLKKMFNTIYNYRSKALHGGQPFPLPMCVPPAYLNNHTFEEKPKSEAILNTTNASWSAKDIPMFLHTFEYLARNALLNWWDSMLDNSEVSAFKTDKAY